MYKDDEDRVLWSQEHFKGMVFASNPELYETLFPSEHESEEDLWDVPESEEDIERIMKELEGFFESAEETPNPDQDVGWDDFSPDDFETN